MLLEAGALLELAGAVQVFDCDLQGAVAQQPKLGCTKLPEESQQGIFCEQG